MGNGMNKDAMLFLTKIQTKNVDCQTLIKAGPTCISWLSHASTFFEDLEVIDGLYLGNIKDAENRDNLSENSITHILSVYNNPKPVFEDMKYLCIHAADASSQNLMQHFKECIGFIHECRLNGGACLVHCLAGASRSTTMVVAYLMTVTNYTWEDCLSAVKAVRSFVDPNPGFRDQLQKYQDTRLSEYRAWLQSSFHPSPFKDSEQVGALLSQQTRQ